MRNFAFYLIMEPTRSIFQCASQWGVPFGLYLSCAAVTSIFADYFAPLNLLFFLLVLATPAVVYYFQRRKYIDDNGFTEYSALWMLGIMLFILGLLISSVIAFLVMQYGRPDFIYEQAQKAIQVYSEMPEMRDSELVKSLQLMVDRKILPSPIEMVFTMFWLVSFVGSIVSAITAFIVQRSTRLTNRN